MKFFFVGLISLFGFDPNLLNSGSINGTLPINQLTNYPIHKDDLCSDNPHLIDSVVSLGNKIGITFVLGTPALIDMDGTYQAFPGKLGIITITKKKLSSVVYCQLITHEYIHALQHLNGGLETLSPLGWPLTYNQIYSQKSLQEAEAYAYQDSIGKVYFH